MPPQPRLIATAATLVLALVAACGDKKQPPAPPPPEPPKLAPLDDSACKLLLKDDAARLLARPVEDGTPLANPGGAECKYTATGTSGTVDILVSANGQDALGANLKSELLGKEPVQLPGIGTRAYRSDTGFAVGVLAKGKFAYVVAASADHTGPTPAAAEKLAQLLANRM